MQIKTTMRYPLIPIGMAIISKSTNKCWQILKKENPRALLMGLQNGAATMENSVEIPQKIKRRTL